MPHCHCTALLLLYYILYYFSSPHIGKNGRFSQSLLFHSIPIPYVVRAYEAKYWVSYGKFSADHCTNSKIFLSPMYSTYWRWLIFFSKIFLSPPYALHSLTVADFLLFFKNLLSPLMYSIRWRWLIFFPKIILSPPYALHSLTVADFFIFRNFSKSPLCSPFVDGG